MLHFAALFLTQEPGPRFSSTSPDKIKLYEATEFAQKLTRHLLLLISHFLQWCFDVTILSWGISLITGEIESDSYFVKDGFK